jgi:hypothetical protein
MNDLHGWVNSFKVEPDGMHVVMVCCDPNEGVDVTVRVSHAELETMLRAVPHSNPPTPPQAPTR